MADIKSREERSQNMAAIKSKDTAPEVWLRKMLFSRGYRYRKNDSHIIGHPDIWLAKYRTAIFIHGCFWHRHPACKYAYSPKTNIEFWETKFEKNRTRDILVRESLKSRSIKVMIVWECAIRKARKSDKSRDELLSSVEEFLHSALDYIEIG